MKLYNNLKPYIFIVLIVLISTLLLWFPFIFKFKDLDFLSIYKNYDGLLYAVIAKTIYNPIALGKINLGIFLPAKYYSAHLPLYPIFIRLFTPFFGYLKSMIGINVLFTMFLGLFFYYFITKLKITQKPLLLTIIFLFLPRFLIVRSVGAPESLFILLILSSIYFFEKKQYLISGIMGGLSVMTKTPGLLLFVVYIFVFTEKLFYKKERPTLYWLFIFFIPIGLLSVFFLYWIQYGDFFAYFHSGDNIHLVFPFSVFNFQAKWVGTIWLEDILFYFIMYLLSTIVLFKTKYRSFFYFSLVFFLGIIFVQHRDISRYSLPLWPFACIAFERFFTSKKFLFTLMLLLPAIYLYAWNFIQYNYIPVTVWTPFL